MEKHIIDAIMKQDADTFKEFTRSKDTGNKRGKSPLYRRLQGMIKSLYEEMVTETTDAMSVAYINGKQRHKSKPRANPHFSRGTDRDELRYYHRMHRLSYSKATLQS